MQTFLPFPNFKESAKCLDVKRLGKQRVEVLQILQTFKYGSRWENHPAVKMWRGYTSALIFYGEVICLEWVSRGYKDTCLDKILAFGDGYYRPPFLPPWFYNKDFHKAHRQILLGKNYNWYSQFGWEETPAVQTNGKWPYIWPVG